MKFFKIFIVNIIIFSFFFYLSEIIIYKINQKPFLKEQKFHFLSNVNPYIVWDNFDNFFEEDSIKGRKPFGVEYKGKEPIVIFGCSYAYGEGLNPEQTFGYKLSHILKRPVYNRAFIGAGLAQMYKQVSQESFYRDVPKSDTVFYILIDDTFRRMYGQTFWIVDEYVYQSYKYVNNKLVEADFNNKLHNLLKMSYTMKLIRKSFIASYLKNPKNSDKITDFALAFFIETRKELEKRWNKKINFIVVNYATYSPLADDLSIKLKANNFIVLNTKDLTNENLYDEKYHPKSIRHPSELAWDLLTEKIVKDANL